MRPGWRSAFLILSALSLFLRCAPVPLKKEKPPEPDLQLRVPDDPELLERSVEELRRKTGIDLVRVPGGEFMMGSGEGFADQGPVHWVRVDDFYIGRFEVTQAQWSSLMGHNPSLHQGCDECPVENVSWNKAREFLKKASLMTGLPLRLPTEAEWEYAAGGGEMHQRWAGTDDMKSLGDYAWHALNSGGRSHPVGRKKPNLFGLHDMSGNVWEWCADLYDPGYYAASPAENPPGPSKTGSGNRRVVRGGSWDFKQVYVPTVFRFQAEESDRKYIVGFRAALDAP